MVAAATRGLFSRCLLLAAAVLVVMGLLEYEGTAAAADVVGVRPAAEVLMPVKVWRLKLGLLKLCT